MLKNDFRKCYCEYEKNRAVVLHARKTTTFVHMIDISETRFSPLSNKITVTNIQPQQRYLCCDTTRHIGLFLSTFLLCSKCSRKLLVEIFKMPDILNVDLEDVLIQLLWT